MNFKTVLLMASLAFSVPALADRMVCNLRDVRPEDAYLAPDLDVFSMSPPRGWGGNGRMPDAYYKMSFFLQQKFVEQGFRNVDNEGQPGYANWDDGNFHFRSADAGVVTQSLIASADPGGGIKVTLQTKDGQTSRFVIFDPGHCRFRP